MTLPASLAPPAVPGVILLPVAEDVLSVFPFFGVSPTKSVCNSAEKCPLVVTQNQKR